MVEPALHSAAVVGAGTMGAGIAMTFADAGVVTHFLDASPEALGRAGTSIAQTYDSAVERGRLGRDTANERLARIRPTSDYGDLSDADVVVEAVFEDLALKREIFGRLGTLCRPGAILATNTSTLDVDAIARAAAHPERCVGLHFFSPAHIMKVLEVVRCTETSAATLAAALEVCRRLGKIPVVVGNSDGFVGNRMLLCYRREAEYLLLAGASPQRVDAALKRFGFAMGVFAVSDLAGIDVGWRSKQERIKRSAAPPFSLTNLPDALVAAGRLGQKTGRGYYRYDAGSRTPQPDPEIEPLVLTERERLGVAIEHASDDEIVERCVCALIMEGANVLQEGVASSAADIDTVWVNGYGFPKARGGPMRYAQDVGIANVLMSIRAFASRDPAFWRIAPLLVEAARSGQFHANGRAS